jgi:hypothetical protein
LFINVVDPSTIKLVLLTDPNLKSQNLRFENIFPNKMGHGASFLFKNVVDPSSVKPVLLTDPLKINLCLSVEIHFKIILRTSRKYIYDECNLKS